MLDNDESHNGRLISPLESPNPVVRANPFATPTASSRSSITSRSQSVALQPCNEYFGRSSAPSQPYFRSRRVRKGEIETPKASKVKDPADKWLWLIPTIGFLCGLAIAGVLIYLGLEGRKVHRFCSVLDEDFSSGRLNPDVWQVEVQVGGFGNGEFDQATGDAENVFIQDGQLHIRPTLQDAALINTNSVINLTAAGTCTGGGWFDCVASTNTTNGTIVPPVKSARLTTRGRSGVSIRYGKVEVRAKIPKGDWMWPAIWMLPTDSVYGAWPASGEIDIMESRGNNYTYNNYNNGNNIASSALHWGPEIDMDRYALTEHSLSALHSQYGDDFHTYGVEWTEDYIYTYVDTELLQVLYVPFSERFWNKGNFPAASHNGSLLVDPWSQTGRRSTPFDQNFFLILNVAVGGTNGWFPDGVGGKPWVDASPTAKYDFWNARDQWYPTWEKSGEMIVDRVQMYELC